jgi:hypothetical protein
MTLEGHEMGFLFDKHWRGYSYSLRRSHMYLMSGKYVVVEEL